MALINTSVPNLIQGVSQQPDASRFAGQCEEQENALSSVAEGLKKRPNTRHVARLLEEAISSNAKIHFINRTEDERYVAIHDGSLRIFNLDTGVEATITDNTSPEMSLSNIWSDTITPLSGASNSFDIFQQSSVAGNTYDSLEASNNTGYGLAHMEILDSLSAGDVVVVSFYVEEITGNNWTTDIRRVNLSGASFINDTDESPASITTTGWKTFTFTITGNTGNGTPSIFLYTPDINTSIKIRGLKVSTNNISNYLTSGVTNPREQLEFLTVADYTFVTNKTKNVQESATKTPDYSGNALVFLKQIGYKVDYSVQTEKGYASASTGTSDATQNGNSAWGGLITTFHGDDALQADRVMYGVSSSNGTFYTKNGLVYQLDALNGITAVILGGKTISVYGHSSISVSDSMSGEALGLAWKKVDAITNLPLYGIAGHVVEIAGDTELNQDNYFVKFVTNEGGGNGRGYWEETVAPNSSIGIDSQTMPHQLVNIGLNTFSLETMPLNSRNAGDDDTNPHPSFVGKKINSAFFFKNRLGFVTSDSVVMSEAGHFFNFYRKTVTTLLDDAPIDINVASTKVTDLKSAIGFQGNLVLFSNNQQFVLRGGDILTSKTVSISSATSFEVEDDVKPISLGSYIYFPFTRGAYTGVREFAVDASTDNFDAIEVTEHVPAYIPKNIIDMAGTTSEDMIVLLSGDEKGSLYIYNYFWNNNQKVLSAWSKFTFTGEIRGIEFIDSTLYAVIVNNGETNLVEMPLESGLTDTNGYVTHLDMRVSATVTNGSDTITLPYTPEDNSVEVYTDDGLKLTATNSGATVTLNQAVTEDTEVFVGMPYTMKYTFSEQLFKAKAGNGTSPSNAAKLMVRNGSIYFDDTAYFQVKVTPKARNTSVNTFTPDVVGSTTIGSLSLDSGFYRFPVFTKAQDTTITIENDSALPSSFQSAEFESFVHSRSNRYG
jgi:hypothetical protein